jgi:hypothetical protein
METGPPNDSGGNNTAAPGTASGVVPFLAVKYLSEKLEQAELLLGYVAEVGIKVDDQVRDGVLKARIASDGHAMTEPVAANLLTALTTLAAKARPVTAESLKSWARPGATSDDPVKRYEFVAIVTGIVILGFSLCTFVSQQLAERINADVANANDLALKLQSEFGPSSTNDASSPDLTVITNPTPDQIWWGTNTPPHGLVDKDVIDDLRTFAATMREIHGYSKQLDYFLLHVESVPLATGATNRESGNTLELTPGLNGRLSVEFTKRIAEYQIVRTFANAVAEKVTVYYGAIATCVLPVLYALLGAGAYLLRSYQSQIRSRTYIGDGRHISRFLIAGIGGLVVGLFNVTQGVSISPFAVAFLVGYAVDVFFAFLEGSLQIFKGSQGNKGAEGTPPSSES